MARGGYHVLTKDDIQERINELLQRKARMEQREKYLDELGEWMKKRELLTTDLLWMYRQMQPKRSDKPVKSKHSLHKVSQRSLKNAKRRASGAYLVGEGKTYRGDVKKIKYLSADGQFVWGGLGRKPDWFVEFLKKGGLPDDLLLHKSAANGRAEA
jgi:DNA-binding protein H-NS